MYVRHVHQTRSVAQLNDAHKVQSKILGTGVILGGQNYYKKVMTFEWQETDGSSNRLLKQNRGWGIDSRRLFCSVTSPSGQVRLSVTTDQRKLKCL